jgi:RNA polymerase sigma factor (sigma-70 family)
VSHPPKDLSDQQIIARVRAGYVELYAQLVHRHQAAVFKIAAGALGNRAVASDITQMTFVHAFDHLERFDVDKDFRPWLHTIARNLVRDELRRLERQYRFIAHYRHSAVPDIAKASALEDSEQALHDALARCMQGLQPVAADVVRLHYEQGLSLEEAGQRIGRTMVATRQLLFRARIALRACVEAAGGV